MKKVLLNGREVDYEVAEFYMDDEIRETIHAELAPCSDQEFIDAYIAKHAEKFDGEEFTV